MYVRLCTPHPSLLVKTPTIISQQPNSFLSNTCGRRLQTVNTNKLVSVSRLLFAVVILAGNARHHRVAPTLDHALKSSIRVRA